MELLFPVRCAFCGCAKQASLCAECEQKLQLLQLPPGEPERRLQGLCIGRAVSVWPYEGVVRSAVLRLKFSFSRYRITEFSRQTVLAVQAAELPQPDLIIPVPPSRCYRHENFYERKAYSTPELLAQLLGEHFQVPVETRILRKKYATLPQHQLPYFRRLANLTGAFSVQNCRKLQNKQVWLVDDIITTGSTVKECAKMLWLYGAQPVTVISLCDDLPKQKAADYNENNR